MNLLPCSINANRQIVDVNGTALQFAASLVPDSLIGCNVYLGLRPEHMTLHGPGLPILVEMVEILGSEQLIHGRHGDTAIVVRCPVAATRDHPIEVDETIQLGTDSPDLLHWFDRDTGLRLDATQ